MKFKRFCVQNFKSIEALMYEPKNKTLAITGPNGKGKTSFKEALFAALTGVFPENAITEGKDFCTVELTLDDDTIITRCINRDTPNYVMVNGKKVTAKAVTELIESRTGINKDTFKIISSGDNIEKLNSAELGALMLEAIPEKLDINKLLTYAGTLTPDVQVEFVKLFPEMPEEFSMDVVNEAYASAFEQRKFLKKQAQNFQAKVDTFMLDEPERKLEDIEHDLEIIIKAEATAEQKKALVNLYNVAVKNRDAAIENINKLKNKLSLNKSTRPVAKELENIEDAIKKESDNLVNAKSILKTLSENIAIFQNTLDNIGTSICPLSEKLVCTTDKTRVKEELEEMINSNNEGIEIQKELIKSAEENLEKLTAQKKAYDENSKAYSEKVNLSAQIEDAEKNLPKLPDKPDMGRDEDFSAQKAILKAEQTAAKAWAQHLLDIENLENAKAQVSIFDAICKLLEPKGLVVTNIMDYYLKVFEGVFNTRAAELKAGFEINFVPIDGVSYKIKTSSASPWKNFNSLSSGEKTLVSFLFIDMFNTLSQQKIMLIDDIDKLDEKSFEQLVELIMSPAIQDAYDTILILGVNHQDVQDTLSKYSSLIDSI